MELSHQNCALFSGKLQWTAAAGHTDKMEATTNTLIIQLQLFKPINFIVNLSQFSANTYALSCESMVFVSLHNSVL